MPTGAPMPDSGSYYSIPLSDLIESKPSNVRININITLKDIYEALDPLNIRDDKIAIWLKKKLNEVIDE